MKILPFYEATGSCILILDTDSIIKKENHSPFSFMITEAHIFKKY